MYFKKKCQISIEKIVTEDLIKIVRVTINPLLHLEYGVDTIVFDGVTFIPKKIAEKLTQSDISDIIHGKVMEFNNMDEAQKVANEYEKKIKSFYQIEKEWVELEKKAKSEWHGTTWITINGYEL